MLFYLSYFAVVSVVLCIFVGPLSPFFDDVVGEEIVAHVGCINDFIFVEGPKHCCHAHFCLISDHWLVFILG